MFFTALDLVKLLQPLETDAIVHFFAVRESQAASLNSGHGQHNCEISPRGWNRTPIQAFDSDNGTDICAELYDHFKYLCNFTHSRPSDPDDRSYTNSAWMGGDTPGFDSEEFQRLVTLAAATTTWIATIWVVAYPEILRVDPLGDAPAYHEFKALLSNDLGAQVLNFASSHL